MLCEAGSPQHLEVAVKCSLFFRLVRACLGGTAISKGKLQCGMPLVVLGVQVSLSATGATFVPSEDKVRQWSHVIVEALRARRLCGGEASKLSGRLQWGGQRIFRKLGRAMLRPIMRHGLFNLLQQILAKRVHNRQIHSKTADMQRPLAWALVWWLQVLELGIVEEQKWDGSKQQPVHLFCDARSTPPRVAAVMIRLGAVPGWVSARPSPFLFARDGARSYCDMQPDKELMQCFKRRGDNQIMSLEILSIALGASRFLPFRHVPSVCLRWSGISTFAEQLRGREVVIWSDNVGAEKATDKGAAKQFDQNALIHAIWLRIAELGIYAWVERVPTKLNIADLPSRCEFLG